MSKKPTGGPAFPGVDHLGEAYPGMTLRQYAAIKLKVPDSGADWLDEMILASQRNELAALAMQASRSRNSAYGTWADLATDAYEIADAMLEARK